MYIYIYIDNFSLQSTMGISREKKGQWTKGLHPLAIPAGTASAAATARALHAGTEVLKLRDDILWLYTRCYCLCFLFVVTPVKKIGHRQIHRDWLIYLLFLIYIYILYTYLR